jgi:hypothetical protein
MCDPFSLTVAAVAQSAAVVYGVDQQRKAVNAQGDALRSAQADDARKTAEAETGAQVAANAKIADAKRRRRGSVLGSGDLTDNLGGTSPSALAAGAPPRVNYTFPGGTRQAGGTANSGSLGNPQSQTRIPAPPSRGASA